MKPYSDNISISEFVPVFTKRPGLNAERQTMRSVTGLSSFVSDVNTGLIWGIRGWVNNLAWSSTAYNNVTWWSGTLTLSNGSSYSITGSFATLTTVTYIFLDTAVSVTALQTTTVGANSVWPTRILVCVADKTVSPKDAQFQVLWGSWNSVFITADNIAANSITGNEIQANSVKANNIDVTDLFAQTITASGTITGATIQTAISWSRTIMSSSWVIGKDSSWATRIQLANAATPTLAFFKSSWLSVSALGDNTYTASYWGTTDVLYSTWGFVAGWILAATSNLDIGGSAYIAWATFRHQWREVVSSNYSYLFTTWRFVSTTSWWAANYNCQWYSLKIDWSDYTVLIV